MANILFIDKGVPTVGIAYMAAYLKQSKHTVKYFRASMKSMFLPNVEFDIENHIDNDLGMKVDLFCFSLMAIDWPWTKEKVAMLKRKYPSIPIAVGGPFATTSPEVVMSCPDIDYVCDGDGEKPLLEMANSIDSGTLAKDIKNTPNISYRENGEMVIQKMSWRVENLDDYPFPDFTIYEGQFSDAFFTSPGLITSRGCPYKCTYCSAPTMMKEYNKIGGYVRQHSVAYVVDFFEKMKKDYGMKSIIINDDVFFLSKAWLREFAPEYKKRVNLPMTCLGHPFAINQEVANLLKEASCVLVLLGLQSGSEDVRLKVGRKETNKQVIAATDCLKKAGVHFSINHIFDFPWDTDEHVHASAALYNDIRPAMVDAFSLVFFPKSDIIKDAIEMGYLAEENLDVINSGDSQVEVGSYGTNTNAAATYTKNPFYKKYCLFFVLLPLLPKSFCDFALSTPERFARFAKLLSRVPFAIAGMSKVFLAIKNGSSFIQLSVLHEWLFYLKKRFTLKAVKHEGQLGQKSIVLYPPLRSDQSL